MDDTDRRGPHPGRGTIQRMDNVAIVVDHLAAAMAFFVELGLELEGEATVEGSASCSAPGRPNALALAPRGELTVEVDSNVL